MKTMMLSLGIGSSTDPNGECDDGSKRFRAAIVAAFQLGPAWQGGQKAIFLRTDKTIDEIVEHVGRAIDDRDLLLVVEIGSHAEVRFSGARFDEVGFEAIFPQATEVEPLNPC